MSDRAQRAEIERLSAAIQHLKRELSAAAQADQRAELEQRLDAARARRDSAKAAQAEALQRRASLKEERARLERELVLIRREVSALDPVPDLPPQSNWETPPEPSGCGAATLSFLALVLVGATSWWVR